MRSTYFKLHLSILLAGMTGIFGKLITLNEGLLVWWRMLLTTILCFLILGIARKLTRITFHDFARISGVGLLLGIHWVFFYGSIKASNISIGVVTFSTVSLFTAVLEPLIYRHRVSFRELFYSLITLAGVLLIFSFDTRYRLGITLGIFSSLFAALFTISTKRISRDYPVRTILPYEMLGGFLVLSCLLPFYLFFFPVETLLPGKLNFIYLLIFALFCTVLLQLL